MISRMNRNHTEMGERRPESGEQGAPSSASLFPVSRRASSLITTLLVLVVLSSIVVAFMQSMSVERSVARSVKNQYNAELAVDAGTAAAQNQLLRLVGNYPDSATAWQILTSSSGLATEGTVMHFRGLPLAGPSATNMPQAASPAAYGADVQLYAWPLISGATPTAESAVQGAFASPLSTNNSIDLNARNWIGAAPGQPRKILRAQWVEILADPSKPRDLVNNPPVARYAYWVDDESFRLNLNVATNSSRETNAGSTPDQIPSLAVISAAIGGSDPTGTASNIVALRQKLTFSSASQAAYAGPDASKQLALATNLNFVSTAYSASLNMSRGGWRRVNINSLFSTGDPVRTQLDRLITTITNVNASPLFGQRFYRSGSPSIGSFSNAINQTNCVTTNSVTPDLLHANHTLIYLNKLAANAKDYIDADNQPTIVENDPNPSRDPPIYNVRTSGTPTNALEPLGGSTYGPNPVIAIGQENIPRLQEYAIHARLLNMSPAGWSGSKGTASFSFTLDHYFEFWNIGTKDIIPADLGADAFLCIYNQPSIGDNPNAKGTMSPVIPQGRTIKINLADIPNLVFRSGHATVITTDPSPNTTIAPSGSDVFIAPVANADRKFSGSTQDYSTDHVIDSSGNTLFNNSYRCLMYTRTTATQTGDYETCVFLGNGQGLLESFCALPIARSGGNGYGMQINLQTPDRLNSDVWFVRGGLLAGNLSSPSNITSGPYSHVGDPRSLNEQLILNQYNSDSSTAYDQTRFISTMDNGSVPGTGTLGALNTNRVDPTQWPDYSVSSTGASDAPTIIANAPMQSVGEIGNLYDPARVLGSAPQIEAARGGGRTLKVGQSDQWSTTNRAGLWDGTQTNASRTWAAWRLTDYFDTTSTWKIRGAYNPNGARRDGGLMLRAMLEGFRYQNSPSTPSNLAGTSLTGQQITNFANAVTARLDGATTNSADDDQIFWERGELSELGVLSSGSTLNAQDMGLTLDRGREELIRRLIQMATTRGSVYSIYVVGQSLKVVRGAVFAASTMQARTIVELHSKGMANSQNDSFNPGDLTSISNRFQPISDFAIKEIYRSSP
jgi:hypothetical protein